MFGLTPFITDEEYERINTNEKHWLVNDTEPIEVENLSRQKQHRQRSCSPAHKRKRTTSNTKSSSTISNSVIPLSSNDINLDLFSPIKENLSHPIPSRSPVLQLITPRSRHPSSSSSSTNTISISHDSTTRIIRCLANTIQRTNEDKKLRIPM